MKMKDSPPVLLSLKQVWSRIMKMTKKIHHINIKVSSKL